MQVQLFDHDKPATVQNFLHYIRSGAYTNMFMERCIPGFVLQGGDYGATNRTSTNSPITGWDVPSLTASNPFNPPFPPQIVSEYYDGPLIKNHFGTLSMALKSAFSYTTFEYETLLNSAQNAFFFNLADNSGPPYYLDSTSNGPFTVFGRVISGTNVLQYFNTLTNGRGIVINGEIVFDGGLMTNSLANLPVNYNGTNTPANSNLVFCDFSLATTLPPDTNPPTVSITSPAANALLTNGPVVQGTASDDVGLADVICVLTPQETDGIIANGGLSVTNYAVGLTNWALTIYDYDPVYGTYLDNNGYMLPGTYKLVVQSQDGAGYLSTNAIQQLTITAIITNGIGTVGFTNAALTNISPVGYPFQEDGSTNYVLATAGANQAFVSWSAMSGANGGSFTSISPLLSFVMSDSTLLTATFISNDIPNSIAFAYPPPNGTTSTDTFNITGTISDRLPTPVTVTCTIFSTNTGFSVTAPLTTTISGTTNWSVAVTNLPAGSYTIQAIAVDAAGESTVITENFISVVAVAITSPAPNAVLYEGSPLLLQGTANGYFGLASVSVGMIPQAAADGTYPNEGVSTTNYAVGTTNWSLGLANTYGHVPPGTYDLLVTAIDTAGYSNQQSQLVNISAVQVVGNGTVIVVQGVSSSINAVGYPFQTGSNYVVEETAATDSTFVNWTAGNQTFVSPGLSFNMTNGLLLTATFISSGIANSIAFTYPPTNAVLTNGTFNITGTITNVLSLPVTVTCHIYSTTIYQEAGPPLTNSGVTNNWSVTVSNLPPDSYVVEVTAVDSGGNSTAINEDFSVVSFMPLKLIILGNGTVSPVTNGEMLLLGTNFEVTATPGSGESFYAWNDGIGVFTNLTQTFTMTSNMTLIAEFTNAAPKVLSFTYPTANAKLTTNSFQLKGKIAASVGPAQITCQIFSANSGLEFGPLTTTGTKTWSVTVTNLPPDDYEVEAVATYGSGESSAISEKFAVLDFKRVTGTYSGLFICTNTTVTSTNSGFFTFTLGASGVFSGKMLFPAYKPVSINTSFYANGSLGFSLNFPGNLVYVDLYLDLTNGTDALTGSVFSHANSWASQLICYRAVTKLSTKTTPATGKYILSLDPTNWPNTNGYASLSVGSSGALALSGALPDSASFSESARVSKDGVWPLYVIPAGYKTNGMLMGWETNQASNSISGQLYWYKAPNVGTYYTNGVNTNVNSTGTNYVSPAKGSYSIVFQAGTNSVLGSNDLSVAHVGAQFKPGSTTDTDKLAISLSTSGVLTGHFVTNNDSKPLQFNGAFFGQSQGGSGFILEGDGQTGYFLLEPQLAQ
jgi:cyclophilin family peptidyl-prolyl cis-trans isomerase